MPVILYFPRFDTMPHPSNDDFEYTDLDLDCLEDLEDLEVEDLEIHELLAPITQSDIEEIMSLESPLTSAPHAHWYEFRQTLDYNNCEYYGVEDYYSLYCLFAPSNPGPHPYDNSFMIIPEEFQQQVHYVANPVEKKRKAARKLF